MVTRFNQDVLVEIFVLRLQIKPPPQQLLIPQSTRNLAQSCYGFPAHTSTYSRPVICKLSSSVSTDLISMCRHFGIPILRMECCLSIFYYALCNVELWSGNAFAFMTHNIGGLDGPVLDSTNQVVWSVWWITPKGENLLSGKTRTTRKHPRM